MNKHGDAEQPKVDAKVRRAQKRAEREESERQEAATLAARRKAQLDEVRLVVGKRGGLLREVSRRQRRRDDLADHLAGFYEEIDKLAKGKALLEVTPLVLEEANQIIRDAKAIITEDTYLDRTKEFVAAGNNPVYPDVVVALRTVRQALERG